MSVELPNQTAAAIYKTYEQKHEPWLRMHVGGSDIGKDCDRRVWMVFRHAQTVEKIEGRILRLFETGHREEARLIQDLKNAGFEVWDRDPSDATKQITLRALDGHLVVHLDGIVLGLPEAPKTPHLIEAKTMKAKHFNTLLGEDSKGNVKPEKRGVKINQPGHYDQMQLGMGLEGLERGLYIVHCKDDERIYCERVYFDAKRFEELMRRAQRIIAAESAPERISKDPAFYKCKFCPVAAMCHGNKIPEKNCRTCVHSSPDSGGAWKCAMGQIMQPGCGEHIYHPSLLDQWAEPVDGDPTWIKYRIKSTGVEFINVAASGFPAQDVPHYESSELVNCNALTIGNPAVESARHILDGRVESTTVHDQ